MIRFAQPYYLNYAWLLLLLVPLLVWFVYWQRRNVKRLASGRMLPKVFPAYNSKKNIIRPVLVLAALLLLVLALADPQSGSKPVKGHKKGLEAVLAIDVSRSMLAEDLQPSRLARVKQLAAQLVQQLKGDKIGLVVFAGSAYVQMPLSDDHAAALMFIDALTPDMLSNQGTDIGNAIEVSQSMLYPETATTAENTRSSKVIVLFSDGEEHDANALAQAQSAAEKGTFIYTVGAGSVTGAPIPLRVSGQLAGYVYDEKGNKVVSKLNEDILKQTARAGNGNYYHIEPAKNIAGQIASEMGDLQRKEQESTVYTDHESRYQWFIGLALLLFLLDIILAKGVGKNIKMKFPGRGKELKKAAAIAGICLALSALMPVAAKAQGHNKLIRRGNDAFEKEDYNKAAEDYKKATEKKRSFESVFNLGDATYKQGNFDKAQELFKEATEMAETREQKAQAWHNLGNTALEKKQWQEGADAYKNALKNDPQDLHSKYNLCYALQKLDEEKQKQQQQNPPPPPMGGGNQDPQQQPQGGDEEPQQQQAGSGDRQQQEPRQPNEISREEAERLLDAMRRDEERIREKMSRQGNRDKAREENSKPW